MLVSVVIPTYNRQHFIGTAIDSVLAQTYRDVEIIVVDDGSTDGTKEALRPYGKAIRYISQRNQGCGAARNTGILSAKGEWVALLDSDDVWHPQKLESQLSAIEGIENVGLVGSPRAVVMPPNLPPHSAIRYLTVNDFLVSSPFGPSSALIFRKCFDKSGLFDVELKAIEDRDMWLRLAVNFAVVLVESPCWIYRKHSVQMSLKPWSMYYNYKRVLNKFFVQHPAYITSRSAAWSHLYMDTAIALLENGERFASAYFLTKSYLRFPATVAGKPFLRTKQMIRLLLGESLFGYVTKLGKRLMRRASNNVQSGT